MWPRREDEDVTVPSAGLFEQASRALLHFPAVAEKFGENCFIFWEFWRAFAGPDPVPFDFFSSPASLEVVWALQKVLLFLLLPLPGTFYAFGISPRAPGGTCPEGRAWG